MRMAVEIQTSEVFEGLGGSPGRHVACSNEAPEPLRYLDVHQMGNMQLVLVAKESRFDARATRGLEQQFQHCRRIDDDHLDSRSSRMIAAADVVSVTRFRPCSLTSISSRVGREAARWTSARR